VQTKLCDFLCMILQIQLKLLMHYEMENKITLQKICTTYSQMLADLINRLQYRVISVLNYQK